MADRDRKGRNGGHKLRGRKKGPSEYRGAKHPSAKLTLAQAKRIHSLAATHPDNLPPGLRIRDRLNTSALARELEISESLVRGVLNGRNWAWLN